MSLIHDAQKTAQQARASAQAKSHAVPKSMIGGFVPMSGTKAPKPNGVRLGVVVPLVALMLVAAVGIPRLLKRLRSPAPVGTVAAPVTAATISTAPLAVNSATAPVVSTKDSATKSTAPPAPAGASAPAQAGVSVKNRAASGKRIAVWPARESASSQVASPRATDSVRLQGLPLAPPPASRATQQSAGALNIVVDQSSGTQAELFSLAVAAQQRGDFARARDLYERAIARDSTVPQAYNNLGTVYRRLGLNPQALAAYHKAITLDANFAPAWSNLGALFQIVGRHDEALAALENAIRLEPTNRAAKVNLAQEYLRAGQTADARRVLEDVISSGPPLPEAHYALAQVLDHLGERADAVQQYSLFLTTSAGRFPDYEARVRQRLQQLRAP